MSDERAIIERALEMRRVVADMAADAAYDVDAATLAIIDRFGLPISEVAMLELFDGEDAWPILWENEIPGPNEMHCTVCSQLVEHNSGKCVPHPDRHGAYCKGSREDAATPPVRRDITPMGKDAARWAP